jgi:outer membrane receptor protein involved in Fe transport
MHYLPPYQTETTGNVYQVSGGFRGKFGSGFTEDWTWDLYYSHGKSTINVQQLEGFTHLKRSQELYAANQYGKNFKGGYAISVIATCQSGIPVFNADGSVNTSSYVSQDCADYMTLRMNHITTLEQNVFEGNMQGSIFELPAGMLKFAAGVGYREENFIFNPDSGFNANQNFPDVVGNIALPVPVNGSSDVKEIYGELLIPVLKDLPLIKSFTLEPGYRISDYSVAPKEDTYKVMADWEVFDWVRFRGGMQYANRAPNIAELFMPTGASTITTGADACGSWTQGPAWGNKPENPNRLNVQTLCEHLMIRDGAPNPFPLYVPGASANNWAYNVFGASWYFPFVLGITGGNPDLESETADTLTMGVVFNSPLKTPALENLRLSIDYYDIEVEGAIGSPSHNMIYQQCLDAQYNPLIGAAPGTYTGAQLAAGNPYCALIRREYINDGMNVYGADRKFLATYINQGALYSKGFDIQLDWNSDFSDIGLDVIPGRLGVNVLYSKLDKYAISPYPGAAVIDYTGTVTNSSFDYRLLSTFSYSLGMFSGGLRWRHLPSLDPAPGSAPDVKGVKSYDQFDLFSRYILRDNIELRGGIDNLFYAKPKSVGASSTNNALGTYINSHDILGRRFYLAVKVWF